MIRKQRLTHFYTWILLFPLLIGLFVLVNRYRQPSMNHHQQGVQSEENNHEH